MNERSQVDRFIAANILPPHSSSENALSIIQEQIDLAISLDFNIAWINPIHDTAGSPCHRRCYDTGILTSLYDSLYAPSYLTDIRIDLPKDKFKLILMEAKSKNFSVLIDFVWKHLGANSWVFSSSKHKGWEGDRIKDIIEYAFNTNNKKVKNAIIQYLKKAIDLYLNPETGYGFAGLRIDAASHLPAEIRESLFTYINQKYPEAIIFEEVLFDSAQKDRIKNLAEIAQEKKIYSHFVTTNLYYKKENAFGELPLPKDMGDQEKICLANQNGISFTGNHDHYTAGWSIILSMAAERYMKKKEDNTWLDSMERLHVSPIKSDVPDIDHIHKTIKALSDWQTIENVNAEQLDCIRYLIPFANEIAREILNKNHPNHDKIFNEFKLSLLKTIANRTLASMSGYFVLLSELTSPFETPRIFSNSQKQPLPFLLLTVADLRENETLTLAIIENIYKNKNKYDNVINFIKAVPRPDYHVKKNKNQTQEEIDNALDTNLFIWLPYIIEYLRNNPDENLYPYYTDTVKRQNEAINLSNALELESYIHQINSIYRQVKTLKCSDYQTFTFATQDDFKIVVRCSKDTTDIIILNLSGKALTINDLDIEKIALWFQLRKFPLKNACSNWPESLAVPFSGQQRINPPLAYSEYYKNKTDEQGETFHDAYNRIIGTKENHQTNLYLGYDIKLDIEKYTQIHQVLSLKTEHRRIMDIVEKPCNEPETHNRHPSSPLYPELDCEFGKIKPYTNSDSTTSKNKTNVKTSYAKTLVKMNAPKQQKWEDFQGDVDIFDKKITFNDDILDNWEDDSYEEVKETNITNSSNIQPNRLFSESTNSSTPNNHTNSEHTSNQRKGKL